VVRIRAGMATLALAGTMMSSGCSDETAVPSSAQADSATATPSAEAMPAAEPAAPVVDPRSPEELVAAGRVTYNANCIACHGMDPTRDGALGPAVSGSSAELIEARVMRGEYPAGYAPKRETRVMVPLPHLKDKLPELVAYLGSLE